MRFANRAGLPRHLALVLQRAYENAQGNYHAGRETGTKIISVTELISPPQKRRLEREHADELEMDVLDTVPSLRGTSLHHILELAGKDAPTQVHEDRLSTQFDNWTITGKSDVYETEDYKLIDFKDSSVWAYMFGKIEWERQLNVLRWIRERNGGLVKSLEIDLFCGDWRRGEARRSPDYPERVVVIPVAMWTSDDTEKYVESRLALHGAAIAPPCSPEERWEKPTQYAVKKKGAKKAIKLYADEGEAALGAQGPGLYVEKRPGESTRCMDYCSAAPWCSQWKADPMNPANVLAEVEA